ncbi:MAG: hypothetical protein FJ117_06455 [Deltaproteobacteria bacterium]|nr:hypothetical protein [Deltaproteobacteria bacterium]
MKAESAGKRFSPRPRLPLFKMRRVGNLKIKIARSMDLKIFFANHGGISPPDLRRGIDILSPISPRQDDSEYF